MKKNLIVTHPRGFANEIVIRAAQEGEEGVPLAQAREAIANAYQGAGWTRGFGGWRRAGGAGPASIAIVNPDDIYGANPDETPLQALERLADSL